MDIFGRILNRFEINLSSKQLTIGYMSTYDFYVIHHVDIIVFNVDDIILASCGEMINLTGDVINHCLAPLDTDLLPTPFISHYELE